MSHAHKLIRDAAKTALTGLASTTTRVFANRLYALADTDLPGLRISLDNETVDTPDITANPIQERQLELVVECCAKANSALDDAVDQMQLEVEKALAAGLTISSKHLDCVLAASQFDDAIGLTPVAVKRVSFLVKFYTRANAPDTLI